MHATTRTWLGFLAILLYSTSLAQDLKPVTIGEIQGVVDVDDDPFSVGSPLKGQEVSIHAVVHHVQQWKTHKGEDRLGFFVQNPTNKADMDPLSSDGIHVYVEHVADFGDPPKVGDYLHVQGKVDVYYGQPEITGAKIVQRMGKNLKVYPFIADPPADREEADRYWRRRLGMHCAIPRGSVVQGPPKTEFWTGDNLLYCVSYLNPLARRRTTWHRRVFRDIHPLDDITEQGFDNGNGFLIALSSRGINGKFEPMRTFDRLDSVTGAIRLHYNEFKVIVDHMPTYNRGADPSDVLTIDAPANLKTLAVATFNVENLYDMRDDPEDDCDFADDPGCPDVRKPFNYLPETQEAYDAKVHALAKQLIEDLHAPDLLLIQEAEDQDFVVPLGQNDPLVDLALAVQKLGGPEYHVANDRDGTDVRGIISAFMYQPARLKLTEIKADHSIFGTAPNVDFAHPALPMNADVSNPKCFNTSYEEIDGKRTNVVAVFSRAMQVAHFTFKGQSLYALNNHFSSRPDKKVERRKNQAAMNAAVAKSVMKLDPDAWVIVGGDLNTFPRPDEPTPDEPTDQLGSLYEAGLINLYDDILLKNPAAAYSYVYKGQSGTLDHIFVSPNLNSLVKKSGFIHVNSDFADGATDHDPVLMHIATP